MTPAVTTLTQALDTITASMLRNGVMRLDTQLDNTPLSIELRAEALRVPGETTLLCHQLDSSAND